VVMLLQEYPARLPRGHKPRGDPSRKLVHFSHLLPRGGLHHLRAREGFHHRGLHGPERGGEGGQAGEGEGQGRQEALESRRHEEEDRHGAEEAGAVLPPLAHRQPRGLPREHRGPLPGGGAPPRRPRARGPRGPRRVRGPWRRPRRRPQRRPRRRPWPRRRRARRQPRRQPPRIAPPSDARRGPAHRQHASLERELWRLVGPRVSVPRSSSSSSSASSISSVCPAPPRPGVCSPRADFRPSHFVDGALAYDCLASAPPFWL
ncbi:unnamed protein product, partial [Prorocentrum cordatum]